MQALEQEAPSAGVAAITSLISSDVDVEAEGSHHAVTPEEFTLDLEFGPGGSRRSA
jgi:hypothetical protein